MYLRCNLQRIASNRWRCRRCGRTITAPPSVPGERLCDALPCGWNPTIVEAKEHIWVEKVPLEGLAASERRFRCLKCRQEHSFSALADSDDLRITFSQLNPCSEVRRASNPATGLVPEDLYLGSIQLPSQPKRGVVTGARAQHWACLGAIAIACAEQKLGLAVADHGLATWQRTELTRIGVHWITHEMPDLSKAFSSSRKGILSSIYTWWKPWVCTEAPYDEAIWVDSDAVITGPLDVGFRWLALGSWISAQTAFRCDEEPLYKPLFEYFFDSNVLPKIAPVIDVINAGVVGWRRNSLMLGRWQQYSLRILNDPNALRVATVRDQSAVALMLAENFLYGNFREPNIVLDERWDWPADGLYYTHMSERRPISLKPAQLLQQARERNPNVVIVHWLGRPKPWEIVPHHTNILTPTSFVVSRQQKR